ncbi:MAG: hypothetical protein ABSB49_04665 [Polyangia bacterium]|jgi:DNA-binding response OmpR family regulator
MPLSRESIFEDISPSRGRLLVAEDNAALRDYLVAVLRAEGYEVAEASTADDLLDSLAVSLRPDIGSGGFDLVIAEDRLVRRGEPVLLKEQWARGDLPPFVLIGSFPDRDAAARVSGVSAVVRLTKPLDIDSLRSTVRFLAGNLVEARLVKEATARN